MGSLLIVKGGQLVTKLPQGIKCPVDVPAANGGQNGGEPPMTATVRGLGGPCRWEDDVSGTSETTIKVNGTVSWKDEGCRPHTVVSDNVAPFDTLSPALNMNAPGSRQFTTVGNFGYHCGVHGGNPVNETGSMWGIIHVVP